MSIDHITLAVADDDDLTTFKKELQDAFAISVIEAFGPLPNGPIPSNDDLDTAMVAPGAVVLRILLGHQKVGGAVLTIDAGTHRNSLDLFFLSSTMHGRGLGRKAWTAIEQRYPETKVWETNTPYFEKRNIHFYVNKCGFKIVEFFGPHHPHPRRPGPNDLPDGGEGFRFEKVM